MVNIASSPSRNVAALFNYLKNPKRGQSASDRNILIVGMNGALSSVAEKQFRDTRKKYGKNGSAKAASKGGRSVATGEFVQAYHVLVSFGSDELDRNDPDAPRQAANIVRRLVGERFPGHMTVSFIQGDGDGGEFGEGGKLHVHIVVNAVAHLTGLSLDSNLVTHAYKDFQPDGSIELAGLAVELDRVLKKEDFKQHPKNVAAMEEAKARVAAGGSPRLRSTVRREDSEGRKLAEYRLWEARRCEAEADGLPFDEQEPFSVAVLKQRIEEALADESVVDLDSFKEKLAELRVDFEQRPGARGFSYAMVDEDGVMLNGGAKRKASKLGTSFMRDAVLAQLGDHRDAQLARQAKQTQRTQSVQQTPPAQPTPPAPKPRRAPKKRQPDPELADKVVHQFNDDELMVDYSEMERRHGLTFDEADQAFADWQALGKPATAFDREIAELRAKREARYGSPESVGEAASAVGSTVPDVAVSVSEPTQPTQLAADTNTARYVSKLADPSLPFPKSEVVQGRLFALAEYEPLAVELLQRGERLDEKRLSGVGDKFMKDFGDRLHPLVRDQLNLRETKKALCSGYYEKRVAAHQALKELEAEAEKRADLAWESGSDAKRLHTEHGHAEKRRAQLNREMEQGIYEIVPVKIESHDEDLLGRREIDRERIFGE
ncbi:relaxase/mobilization nuclease domain-containing protein [Leucobacter sp. HY1910]